MRVRMPSGVPPTSSVPGSRTITVHEPDLTLIGLALVYAKNQ